MKVAKGVYGISVLFFIISFLVASTMVSQSATLNPIVDENTSIPEGTGDFSQFLTGHDIGSGDLAFVGANDNIEGIYAYRNASGALEKLVDLDDFEFTLTFFTNSQVPFFKFLSFDTQIETIGDGDFVFSGQFGLNDPFDRHRGIWTYIDGELNVVADENLDIPGGAGFGDRFDVLVAGSSYIGDNKILFGGHSDEDDFFFSRGIYIYDISTKSRSVAVDGNTQIPGLPGINFSFFDVRNAVPLAGGGFVFRGYLEGSEGQPFYVGLYGYVDGTVFRIADTLTTQGPDNRSLTHVGNPRVLENGNIAFIGAYEDGSISRSGIYIYNIINGTVSEVVRYNSVFPPGGPEVGSSFSIHDVESLGNGNDLAFNISHGLNVGVYAYVNNAITTIANRVHTLIPGGSENFTYFSNLIPLNGGGVAFRGGLNYKNQTGVYGFVNGNLVVFADLSDITGFGTVGSSGLEPYGNQGVSFLGYDTLDIEPFFGEVYSDRTLYTSNNATPDPLTGLTFSSMTPGVAGLQNYIKFDGADSNEVITIVWGLFEGSDPAVHGPCAGTVTGITNPRTLGQSSTLKRTADTNGGIDYSVIVPFHAAGVTIYIQGIAENSCETSNVRGITFQ